MADDARQHGCPDCAKRDQRIAELEERLNKLESELAKAKKHSGNSSKPPSSDIVRPRRKSGKRGRPKRRRIGGQPGHGRHERTAFSPEELDQAWLWYYAACPCCGGQLQETEKTGRTIQQVELLELPIETVQHTAQGQWCPKCEKTFIPTLPDQLRKAGLVGPRLTALVGFLKGACHMSYSTLRKYFRDVIGVTISRRRSCLVRMLTRL